jgi:hypothetical protein
MVIETGALSVTSSSKPGISETRCRLVLKWLAIKPKRPFHSIMPAE